MLIEVSIPLDTIGRARCDFDGSYHIEVNGQEADTDEKTYWQVILARKSHSAAMQEVDEWQSTR